ncbi:hypothetical protein [Actinomadura rupiterrae]|uniref:hypothetical protein n=1 Tax=Actinomadura rupiterrae TaxID=559627 RepID=UPI0020A3E37A|nr:hypothetical protein [Actinomadura rupiterrae]MCP2339864.1 hypothetical protein [Actinomadura rupiterrae]
MSYPPTPPRDPRYAPPQQGYPPNPYAPRPGHQPQPYAPQPQPQPYAPQPGYPPQPGPPHQGPPPQGPPPQGYPPQGYAQPGYAPPPGYPQQGYAQQPPPPPQQYQQPGYPPPGYPQQGGPPADLYAESVLVYDQPQGFFSVEANYTIWAADGRPAAYVREEGVNGARKVFRALNQGTQNNAERRLSIVRPDGMPLFYFYKPYGFAHTPKMHILSPQNQPIGYLRKRALRGWELLDAYDQQIGYYELMGGRVKDNAERELALFRRASEGFGDLLAQAFTGSDRYVLRQHVQLPEPFKTLTLACPLAFDTAVSQNRSLGGLLT